MENERLEERLGFWAGLRQGYAEEMAQLRGVSIERKYVEYNSLGRVGRFVGGEDLLERMLRCISLRLSIHTKQ